MMAMMMLATLASCMTDDQDASMTLTGTWQGNLGIYMYSEDGADMYEAYQTTIHFDNSGLGSTSGTGYELDRFKNAPWSYIYNPIQWSLTDGVIYLYYPKEGTTIRIYNYSLNSNYFSGKMEDGTEFELEYVGYFDWSPYSNGYNEAKTRGISVDRSTYKFACKHNAK